MCKKERTIYRRDLLSVNVSLNYGGDAEHQGSGQIIPEKSPHGVWVRPVRHGAHQWLPQWGHPHLGSTTSPAWEAGKEAAGQCPAQKLLKHSFTWTCSHSPTETFQSADANEAAQVQSASSSTQYLSSLALNPLSTVDCHCSHLMSILLHCGF